MFFNSIPYKKNDLILSIAFILLPLWVCAQQPMKPIPALIEKAKMEGQAFKAVQNVFTKSDQTVDLDKIIDLSKVTFYNYSPAFFEKKILHSQTKTISIALLIDNQTEVIADLMEVPASFYDYIVTSSSGKNHQPNPRARHYRGVIRGMSDQSLVALSMFDEEMMGLIAIEGLGNYNIGKIKNGKQHMIVHEKNIKDLPDFECGTVDDLTEAPMYKKKDLFKSNRGMTSEKCVRLYFETAYDIFQNRGSIAAVENYVTALFNQVATLFANDNITTKISQIKVWDTPDPYTGNSCLSLLTQFQDQINSFDGDLGQLLTFRDIGCGKAAGFNGLCNANQDLSLSVATYLASSFPNVPTHSWSVTVVTHELGHLFGSRHTHACAWNGNNTAIDGCWFTEGSCPQPPNPPNGGTIMSYCQLQSVGINFNLGFGPQPGNLIRNNVANATCILFCCTNDEVPTISCPADTTVNNNAGSCSYTVAGTEWDVRLNCVGGNITNDWNNTSSLAGAIFPLGSTTVIWTAIDPSGNISTTCSFTVTMNYNEDLNIGCPSELVVVENDPGQCNASIDYGSLVVAVDCDNNAVPWTTISGPASGDTIPVDDTLKVIIQTLLGDANDYFGHSVSISGDYAIIGAPKEDPSNTTNAGSAYIFKRNGTTWAQQQKITASDAQAYDAFGFSVSISGDYAIVGAPVEDPSNINYAGSAYIFKRSGTAWAQQQKINASDAQANDYFGHSVSISGDYAIVGAYWEDPSNLNDAGSAYIFKRSGTAWAQQQKINASDAQANDRFGWSVSISGDYAIVGAYWEDPSNLFSAGSAYIFKRSGTAWAQQQKINASDKQVRDWFGFSVSISGDYAIVGAFQENPSNLNDAGSAYIFNRSGTTWTQQQKITASDKQVRDYFGSSVSISEDYAIVGAYGEDPSNLSNAGSAYIFNRSGTTWTQQQKINTADAQADDWFGWSVSIDGDYAVVGAFQEDLSNHSNAGSAYIFNRSATTWTQQQKINASGPNTCSFGITVIDAEDPTTITCPANITVNNDVGSCSYTVVGTVWDAPFTTDNCAGGTITNDFNNTNSLDGAIFPLGSTTVIWIATDAAGNTSMCGFTVTVNYIGDLNTTCPSELVVVENDPEQCNAAVDYNSLVGVHCDSHGNPVPWTTISGSASGDKIPVGDTLTVIIQSLLGNTSAEDYFGYSVSISGDYAIVSAFREDLSGTTNAGSAYIFKRSGTTWTQQQKINASDAQADDQFGHSVSISGDYAIVGAPYEDPSGTINAGSAYIFKRNGTSWIQQQKINASDAQVFDWFGCSVSISGDYAIVGAYHEHPSNINYAGSAYIFKRSGMTWTQQQKITASDAQTHDFFGYSVSISGDYAIVGAYWEDPSDSTDAGSAYIFNRSGTPSVWTEQQKINASDAQSGDRFGHSVSISGDYAIVGAYWEDPSDSTDAGSAYIFNRSGTPSVWTEQQKINASDAQAEDYFGHSVSISGDYAIVGAYYEHPSTLHYAGSAYIFNRSGTSWTQQQKINASDAHVYDRFGYSVSVSGDYAIVGAYWEDPSNTYNAGSAYIFNRSGTSWTQQQKINASDVCSFDITVTDAEGPTISCPADTTVNNDTGSCSYTVVGTGWDASFTDNCAGGTITNDFNNTGTLAGAIFPIGNTTVIWTATDAAGNTSTCSFTVTVVKGNPCSSPSAKNHNVYNDISVTVYPNPDEGYYTIEIASQGSEEGIMMRAYDVSGKLITQKVTDIVSGKNMETMDLTSYPNGVYFIQLEGVWVNKHLKVIKQ